MSTLLSKITAVLLMTVALASCQAEMDARKARELAALKGKLPPDCKLTDLGEYGRIDQLVMIRCPNSQTTVSVYDRVSKHNRDRSAVMVSD